MNAMEMTSAEILDSVCKIDDVVPAYDKLEQVLKLADYVKFAKFRPLPDENDLSLMNAYFFVNQTKPVELPKNNNDGNSSDDNDEKAKETTDKTVKQ